MKIFICLKGTVLSFQLPDKDDYIIRDFNMQRLLHFAAIATFWGPHPPHLVAKETEQVNSNGLPLQIR